MPLKMEIDALAAKISREIENLGACSLKNQELSVLWGHAVNISELENQMHLTNFSTQYGFICRMDTASRAASFRKVA